MVYPGAVHRRFQHALGVMHLAGRFAEHLYDQYVMRFGRKEIPEREYVVEIFRLAGLLHDVGHGPLGHTLDNIYRQLGLSVTHELVTKHIVKRELGRMIKGIKRSPNGSFRQTIEPEVVCEFIKPRKMAGSLWERSFSHILRGLFSADKLDFISRDSYFCGTKEYGSIDGERLIRSSFVTKDGFTVHKSALPAIKAFLWSRLFMYENVYYHRTVRSFDYSFECLLKKIVKLLKLGDPRKNLKCFYSLTDTWLHGCIPSWVTSQGRQKRKIGIEWSDLLNKRKLNWYLAKEKIIYEKVTELGIKAEEYKDALTKRALNLLKGKQFLVDMPFLEVRPENPLPRDGYDVFWVYDPYTNDIDKWSLARIFQEIPVRYLGPRLYTTKIDLQEVKKYATQILESKDKMVTHA